MILLTDTVTHSQISKQASKQTSTLYNQKCTSVNLEYSIKIKQTKRICVKNREKFESPRALSSA